MSLLTVGEVAAMLRVSPARRFVATTLAADPKTAAMVLGHANTRITMDTHARGTDEMRQRAADMIEEVVG